jgi:hypothetical protein
VVAAIQKIVHSWCTAMDAVHFRGDTDKNYHGAKFSIPVSVLHQSPWKFGVYFYLVFSELLQEHLHFHAIVIHVLHLVVERNPSPSQFSVYVINKFSMWNSAKWIMFPMFHHSSRKFSIGENRVGNTCLCILHLQTIRHFDYDSTSTQYSHTSSDSELQAGTADPACSSTT